MFKKSLIAVAALSAFVGSAMAADITISGRIDTGLNFHDQEVKENGVKTVDTNTFQMKAGQYSGSRVTIKGSEDLGNGMKAGFILENGFNGDDGTWGQSRLFGREAIVYLEGDFGHFSMGRVGALTSGVGSYSIVYGFTPFGTGWGAGPVSPAMVEEWKTWSAQQEYLDGYTEDPRLTGSIWSYKAYDPEDKTNVLLDRKLDPNEPDYTVSYRYFEQTGYFQKKYININSYNEQMGGIYAFGLQAYPDITTYTSNQLIQIQDLIHIRFADVLLMQSELKEDATGLNRVRARSHLAPVAYSLDAIKNERRWELAFESQRWWDLLRWSGPSLEEAGDALNKQTGFDVINAAQVVPMVNYDYKARLKATEGYWPIPQDEIDLSNGVLEQNPGWDQSAMFIDWAKM